MQRTLTAANDNNENDDVLSTTWHFYNSWRNFLQIFTSSFSMTYRPLFSFRVMCFPLSLTSKTWFILRLAHFARIHIHNLHPHILIWMYDRNVWHTYSHAYKHTHTHAHTNTHTCPHAHTNTHTSIEQQQNQPFFGCWVETKNCRLHIFSFRASIAFFSETWKWSRYV